MVGFPVGEPKKTEYHHAQAKQAESGEQAAESAGVVWHREYSSGIALVNPGATVQTFALPLPPAAGQQVWKDLYGHVLADQNSVSLPPASGLVLVRAPAGSVA